MVYLKLTYFSQFYSIRLFVFFVGLKRQSLVVLQNSKVSDLIFSAVHKFNFKMGVFLFI
jgi:hypothetical protein